MMYMRSKALSFIMLVGFLYAQTVFGMTSTNFSIGWDNINSGGLDSSTSTNFGILDTIGDNASGTSTSANFNLSAGYRAIEDAANLSFIVSTQENASRVMYTAFDNSAKTVTVTSAASYNLGDYIVVVENFSFSQKIAIGKITNIVGLVITVDSFSGDGTSMSAVPPAGSVVFRLSGSAADFGTVTPTGEPTTVTMSNVLSTATTGYTVYMYATSGLTNGSATMTNVSDGAVSLGSEEYGVSVTGTSALGSGSDFAVPTTQQAIQNRSGATPSTPDRMGVIYKLAITASTASGLYSQNVIYTLTANY